MRVTWSTREPILVTFYVTPPLKITVGPEFILFSARVLFCRDKSFCYHIDFYIIASFHVYVTFNCLFFGRYDSLGIHSPTFPCS
jgi:hypothetical protein